MHLIFFSPRSSNGCFESTKWVSAVCFLAVLFTVLWDSKKWVVWFSVDGFKLSDDDNPAFHCSFCPPHDLLMDYGFPGFCILAVFFAVLQDS
jgi:hypothetical protein